MKVQPMYSFNPTSDGEEDITMSFHTDEITFEIFELSFEEAEEIVKSLSDGLETIRDHVHGCKESAKT